PGSTASRRKVPSDAVTVSRETLVDVLVIFTVPPEIVAPAGSVIVPTRIPLLDCARTIGDWNTIERIRSKTAPKCDLFSLANRFMIGLLNFYALHLTS